MNRQGSLVVTDDLVCDIHLYRPKVWLLRLDVMPFVIYYTLSLFSCISSVASYRYAGMVAMPLGLALHLYLFLVAQSSVNIRCKIGNSKTTDPTSASLVHVSAAKNAGNDRLLTMEHVSVAQTGDSGIPVLGKVYKIAKSSFQFQKVSYDFDEETSAFKRLEYPVSGTIREFLSWRGHSSNRVVDQCLHKWGYNEFDIPMVNFLDLYVEYLIAPFFVFQCVCLFLWSLDDYWYYSAFTLIMLMFFQGMMCRMRQNSLAMLRAMRRPPYHMFCFRQGQWVLISSDTLVPGDVISLSVDLAIHNAASQRRSAAASGSDAGGAAESIVPCDALIIRGGCVTNEAMLTGESVPQTKECVREAAAAAAVEAVEVEVGAAVIDLGSDSIQNPQWRRNMVFGGTSLLQHNGGAAATSAAAVGYSASDGDGVIPPAPDHGCVAVVVRTGFATTQGSLMRKILFATERVVGDGDSIDTTRFIAVLVFFAVIAAAYVLYHGLGDERRNQFRLILHCIMIVTSVVPPELPMELSLAVTNSVASLSKGLVYCTEPFRLAYAGKLDVLCFDKTGTLTQDRMQLRGIVARQHVDMFGTDSVLQATGRAGAGVGTGIALSSSLGGARLGAGKQSSTSPGADDGAELTSSTTSVKSSQAESLAVKEVYVCNGGAAPGDVTDKTEASEHEDSDITLCIMGGCHDLIDMSSIKAVSAGGAAVTAPGGTSFIGDPLEIESMLFSGFEMVHPASSSSLSAEDVGSFSPSALARESTTLLTHTQRKITMCVREKFAFDSSAKRMSVVADIFCMEPNKGRLAGAGSLLTTMSAAGSSSSSSSSSSGARKKPAAGRWVLTKGAPEVLETLLLRVPSFYRATYVYHMAMGRRVLAMAYKQLNRSSESNMGPWKQGTSRKEVEKELIFAGFLVFDCELKPDSKSVLRELRRAGHRLVMITGDSAYTAADVARRLGMLGGSGSKEKEGLGVVDPNLFLLHVVNKTGSDVDSNNDRSNTVSLVWRRMHNALNSSAEEESSQQPDDLVFDLEKLPLVAGVTDGTGSPVLCVTGSTLAVLENQCGKITYAAALAKLCPHVSVFARVSPSHKEAVVAALKDAGQFTLMCGDGTNDVGALKAAHVGVSIVNDPMFERMVENAAARYTEQAEESAAAAITATGSGGRKKKAKGASAKERLARATLEMQAQQQDPTVVKLGDASVASPFTSRRTSIDCVLSVVRQGRCTLVTTIQVYKILALNCLVTAFVMSSLYLLGLKSGDTQMTASGLVTAGLFFFLSQAKPLQEVAAVKPPSSVFDLQVAGSIVGQFCVHLISLLTILHLCGPFMQPNDTSLSPDGKFQPNVVNSAMYLLSSAMQINNFVINYRGHPFTQAISDNKYLWRSVQGIYFIMLVLVGGQFEPLNDLLQMVPFPNSEFQVSIIGVLVFNFCASFVIEHACRRYL